MNEFDEDQKIYESYRRRKHSPTAAVRKLRELKFKRKHKRKKLVKGKKIRKIKYFYDGDQMIEEMPIQEIKPPLSQRLDFGMQPERREIATEAAVRETTRISGGIRKEGGKTKKAFKTAGSMLFLGGTKLGHAIKIGGKKSYEGAYKATHYPQVVDERVRRELAMAEQRYGPISPHYIPEDEMPKETYREPPPMDEYEPTEPESSYPSESQEYGRRRKKRKTTKAKKSKRIKKKRKVKIHRSKKRKTKR
jgi:hypothetical protein